MNWAMFAIGVGVLGAVSVYSAARRGTGSRAGYWLAVPLLAVACLNGAAPVRALVDRDYMGYVFGLLAADRGLAVTLIAGPLVLAALVAAHLAVLRRSGPWLWFVAAVCGTLAGLLGIPLIAQFLSDPAGSRIQLGEYLTVPPLLSTFIILCGLCLPFVAGALWAGRAAMRR